MKNEKYFTRTIPEGTVKRSHHCSFDNSILLEMRAIKSGKVADNMFSGKDTAEITKQNMMAYMSGLTINGLPIVYEDLGNCFDSDEIMEVIVFITNGDMSIFGGANPDPKEGKNS